MRRKKGVGVSFGSGVHDEEDSANRDAEIVCWPVGRVILDLNEDSHWDRRNIFDNVVTTTPRPRFEGSVQLEIFQSVYFIQRVHLMFYRTSCQDHRVRSHLLL